jgi:hypothetical protein
MLYTVNLIGLSDSPAAEESISAWDAGLVNVFEMLYTEI